VNEYEQREADALAFYRLNGEWPVIVVTDQGETLYARDAVPAQYLPPPVDPAEVATLAAFEAEQIAKRDAELADFKARGGEPRYPASSVKIAADKLDATTEIEATIGQIVATSGEKELLIWWQETPTISRGDAEWLTIEADLKTTDAAALFALAATI